MPFANDIVGGTKLLIPAIRSPNYIPGVQGWTINRDGSSEFASGTFRGPVVIIDPSTGAVLASIGATGNGAFQVVSVTDLIIGNTSLAALLAGIGAGIVGQFRTTSTLPASGVSSSYTATCWTSFPYNPNRLYRVLCSTSQWTNNNLFNDQDLLARFLVNQPGVTGGASNAVVHQTKSSTPGSEFQRLDFDFYLAPGLYAAGPMTLALQLAGSDTNNWTHTPTNTPFQMTVLDAGPVPTSRGGTGAPSGLLTWTATYVALATRSYAQSGAPCSNAADRDNYCLQGDFSDSGKPYKNGSFEIVFNGSQMRTDLAGATINYVRLWLYCNLCEDPNGSLYMGVSTKTAVDSTFNDDSIGGYSYGEDDTWPVPGWHALDLTQTSSGVTAISLFLSNSGNTVIGKQTAFGLAPTGFAGYGWSDPTKRPYIEINYVGNPPGSGSGTGYGVTPYGSGGYGQ